MPRQIQSKHKVALLTDWGKSLGTGHVQRMLSLLEYLLHHKKIDAEIVCDKKPAYIKEDLEKYFVEQLSHDSTLIIRDQRDSNSAEILKLKKTAHVVVIDDQGEGRDAADLAIDLLPVPGFAVEISDFASQAFIFGYNFFSSLEGISINCLEKKYDFCVYLGYGADLEYQNFLKEIIPQEAEVLWLNGESVYQNDDKSSLEMNFAEALLKSRAVISHFGLLLYEAHLCGCKIFTINPGAYHSGLADSVKQLLNLKNFGIYPDLKKSELAVDLMQVLDGESIMVSLDVIKARVLNAIETFIEKIDKYLQ
jgi:spore coat polysaccharide biosynthesis predicted glycosyltransferase SpsG